MTAFSELDHLHMAHALRLAERGLYTTQPNPRVGCVLAHGYAVVGAGWHRRAGEAHAEVLALREAGSRASGATAYVTLEPCAHHGRTPPCAEALIAAGVSRVVAASADPYAEVAGRGIEMLRAAGITVDVGLLQDDARALNPGFFSRIERGRPWLRMKLAMSLDGRTALANGESKWITGEPARADVQCWRARSSAILTGSGTVLADNPHLTVRPGFRAASADGENPHGSEADFVAPLRVVLDRQVRTPLSSHVLDATAPTLLVHAPEVVCTDPRFARIDQIAVPVHGEGLDLPAVLGLLAARGCNEVQVEAGPTLCGALFAAGLVDELLLYVAPVLLGDQARPLLHLPLLADMAQRWQLRVIEQRALSADWRLRLRPH